MTYSKLLGTCHSQYNLLCRTSADISIEKEMNNQTKADSLFGPAGRDVAICGHNSPSVTVRVSSVSLHTVTPIHARHTAFRAAHPTLVMHPARHCCFCWAGGALACSDPECQAETRTGWACVECRSGWEGAGSVTNWMRRLRRAGHDWPGLWPATVTAASSGGQSGFLLLRHQRPPPMCGHISQDGPPTAAQ